VLYTVSFIGALLGNTFQIACITAVAKLVRRDQLTEANGRLQASFALMYLIGPLLAGVICARFGPVTAIAIDAASFVASALSIVFVRLKRSDESFRARAPGSARETWNELVAGYRFLVREPTLRAVTVLLGAMNFLLAARLDMVIYHVKNGLHRGDQAVGVLFGFGATGAIFGAVAASRFRRRYGFGPTWLAASVLMSLSTAAVGSAESLVSVIAFTSVLSGTETIRSILSMSHRQEVTPDPLLGRVTSAFWLSLNVPAAIGAAMISALAERIGTPRALEVIGLASGAIAIAGLMTVLRTSTPPTTSDASRAVAPVSPGRP
jgi:Na+/melibiose symporter-like transporter